MAVIPISRPQIGAEEQAAVARVLASGSVTQGLEVEALEREFADIVDDRRCVALSSGTSALHLGLLAAGVGPGDEVIVPSFSFAATANAVSLTGAQPVFADIDPVTFCLSASGVEGAITDRTVGFMPVHLYGQPADMTALERVATRHGLALFEDAAQAHGAQWAGRAVGSFGQTAAFSLYATKNITSGEGGMLAVADEALQRSVRLLRNQGMEVRYRHEVVGFNARMTDLHAAIGRVQLRTLAEKNAARSRNAASLLDGLRDLEGIALPVVRPEARPVWHQFTVLIPERRDLVAQVLRDEFEIETGIYYPVPIHRSLAHNVGADLPATERAARECLSLPVHPSLSAADLEHVISSVRSVVERVR